MVNTVIYLKLSIFRYKVDDSQIIVDLKIQLCLNFRVAVLARYKQLQIIESRMSRHSPKKG